MAYIDLTIKEMKEILRVRLQDVSDSFGEDVYMNLDDDKINLVYLSQLSHMIDQVGNISYHLQTELKPKEEENEEA